MKIRDCKVNHMRNPIGYMLKNIVFSWMSEGFEVAESRLVVWERKQMQEVTWEVVADTGWSNLNSLAAKVDISLSPRTGYTWQVQSRDAAGKIVFGEKQYFETGKMEEPWQGKWITCDNVEKRLPIFTKEFSVCQTKELISARLYICGLGLYEAYIDGEKVSEELLAPGCHSYNYHVQSRTYDVTSLVSAVFLKKRERLPELSVMLGDGWYKGRFDFERFSPGFYGDEYALIAELHLNYGDGSEEVLSTDRDWMVKRSNIVFSGIYDGEIVDATLPELPAKKAKLVEKKMPPIVDRLSVPVVAHERFEPQMLHTPKGELVLDMGQNLAGIFELRVHEPEGTKIHLQFGEVLQAGNFYRDNLRTARAEYIFVSDGREHILRPHFTYYGYRYVKVEGISELKKEDFTGVAIYSDIEMNSRLVCGNEMINQLISNTIWGMKSNFVDIPTDCPQRDERMGWTGDAQAFSETAFF